ncbi:MAG: type II secretion system protein [Peptoniphilus sp.]|uniref:type II secretion system protein n=1 Tax=Peptoniphilus sp. TaxID=1971214 RepID=UPI002A7588B7|nr:type II secretion system protein [Peptoniphilus sp.]MDY2987178.1 type II secretion system protein [Peptoniphilus sp.]
MKKGFTLIEIAVVLGILVILMGISIQSIYGIKAYKQKLAVKNFVSDLNSARGYAVANNKKVSVKISEDYYSYEVNDDFILQKLPEGLILEPETKEYKDIVFTRKGVSSREAGRTINFKTERKTYTVTISPVSGKVRLSSGN